MPYTRRILAYVLMALSLLMLVIIWSNDALAINLTVLGLVSMFCFAPLSRFEPLATFGAVHLNFRHLGAGLLVLAALSVLIFPGADAAVSMAYYQGEGFVGAEVARIFSHHINRNIAILGLLGAVVVVPVWLIWRQPWLSRWAETLGLFFAAQVILMFVVVHGFLKPFFGRSRPRHIAEQLAEGQVEPWWQLGTECARNCSMPSGEASAGFACWAAALAWNRGRLVPSLIFTLVFGFALGFIRIIGGAHYASDVVISAVFMMPLSYGLWWLYQKALRWWQGRADA